MPRSDYRSDYSPPRRGGGTRVTEYEDIDIRERRDRRGPRERDYLRDAYERVDDRNETLVRREESDERSGVSRRRDKEYREEEVVIARSKTKDQDRPRRREVEEEEDIRIRERDREGPIRRRSPPEDIRIRRRERPIERDEIREEVREEVVYRPRRERPYEREEITEEWIHVPRERPIISREVEDYRFAPPKRRQRRDDVESITIKERERDRPREDIREEVIDIRERPRSPPRGYREEEIDIRERERNGPRGSREEEIRIRERDRDRPRDFYEEDVRIRERERPKSEFIDIREKEQDRRRDYRDEEIRIVEQDRRPGYRDEEIRIRERERDDYRDRPRDSGSDYARRKPRDDYKEEVIIKHKEREGVSGRSDEIVIRKKEKSPPPPARAPSPPPPPPEPEPIRPPPAEAEILTRRRRIDGMQSIRGMEDTNNTDYEEYRVPASAPPRRRTPSTSPTKSSFEEIAIRHRDRDGRHEDDIVIKHRDSKDEGRSAVGRRRSNSVDSRRPLPPEIDDEADFYARKNAERAKIGEAYHGATKDWAIVDVPPGTNRVQMDGVGGASEEITWQRYNGVRRSKFIPETNRESERELDRPRFIGARPKTDSMWTEITKDLVVKEALDSFGYEYEETEWFYYVMEYLRYEDVRRLVQISDEIRARRRERIREIEWESQMPREPERLPPRLSERPWDEERFVEREFYERRSPRPILPPVPVAPVAPVLPGPRVIEKGKIVVIRTER